MYTLWLTIWKHFISEKGQSMTFLPPSCKQQSCIFYFTFKRKEIYKPIYIYIWYFYESNNSSRVHVSYDHNSTYEHRISSTSWTLLDMMAQGYGLAAALSLMSKNFPGNKSTNTYLSVHSNATTSGKYILHQYISNLPIKQDSSFNTEQRANKIHLEYSPSFVFIS